MIYSARGRYGGWREGHMTRERLIEEIRRNAAHNRLSCERAHELSKELGISLRELGELCNELKIKIVACELGCF